MPEEYSLSRNETGKFAGRVRKNLHFIIKKRVEGHDVHEVTQLVISLLGLIAFPWQDGALENLESRSLRDLEEEGWPQWDIIPLDERGKTDNLRALLRHLRNAAAHRRFRFSSDSREMDKVDIEFEDALGKNAPPYWRARINAADLKEFCERVTEQLEDFAE